jgi:hypothetical protein
MKEIHLAPDPEWAAHPGLAQRLVGLFNRSAAMGLLTGPAVMGLEPASIRNLVADLQQHGLAGGAAVALAPLLRKQPAQWDSATEHALEQRLDQMAQALEDSPTPATEWPAMRTVFGDELLAGLLRLSASSLRRYATGQRTTPDTTAARLHWLAMVASDLAGAYNHAGMRRWFERPRAQLDGRSPGNALGVDWHADDAAALQVRALAAALSGAQALAV